MRAKGLKMNARFTLCAALTVLVAILAGSTVEAEVQTSAKKPGNGSVCTAPITVLSFNVRNSKAQDGLNAWRNRKDIMVRTLKGMSPDVFGVQEAYSDQLEYVKQNLPEYTWFGLDRYGAHKNEHMAIFYHTGKLELMASGNFWLSDKPEVPGSITWRTSLPRMVTWGLFRNRNTGQQFYFYNTHFHHTSDADVARTKSAQLIAQRAIALPTNVPVILTGDFNTNDHSQAYVTLAGGNQPVFRDTRVVAQAKSGPEGTFHGFSGNTSSNRIDFILVRGNVQVLEQSHVVANENGRYPSDHFPVRAVLQLCSSK